MNLGIIGCGVVGQATANGFRKKGHKVFCYDINGKFLLLNDVLKQCNILFICVPTPAGKNGDIDLSMLDDAINKVAVKGKIVVIRSTVPPGTTRKYAQKYKNVKFIFNPEFLTEKTAEYDFLHPDKIVVGGNNKKAIDIVSNLYKNFKAPIIKTDFETAEMVKYFINCFYATKVIFANQIYDICQKAGINYEKVKKIAVLDKRIADSHFEIFHKGYRGFGGKCLPKDLSGLIAFAKKIGVEADLFQKIKKINEKLLSDRDYEKYSKNNI